MSQFTEGEKDVRLSMRHPRQRSKNTAGSFDVAYSIEQGNLHELVQFRYRCKISPAQTVSCPVKMHG